MEIRQDQILAVRVLAAKLPNSDLNFAVDVSVDLFLPVGKKNPSRDVIEGQELSPKFSSAENHQVTWGTWEKQESPTSRDAFFFPFLH